MRSCSSYSVRKNNSFNVEAVCPKAFFPKDLSDLQYLPKVLDSEFYILGEGSNTLFVESQGPIIIKPDFKGMEFTESDDEYTVIVGASENWHELVCFCLERGINGLENLALIPGSVGAAPVQNIGAYGVEFSDFCTQVEYFDLFDKQVKTLSTEECHFSYRDSIFKQSLRNRGLITQVVLSFPKSWQPNLNYQGLNSLAKNSSASNIMLEVIKLRQSKLPDPLKLPNAGSFFKNPVISKEEFNKLIINYPKIPNYPQANDDIKLAAGWLIEQTGLKGIRYKSVGVHNKQALVLVNYDQGLGREIVSLAKFIQRQVKKKFDIYIVPEVRMISALGEQSFSDLEDLTPIEELKND